MLATLVRLGVLSRGDAGEPKRFDSDHPEPSPRHYPNHRARSRDLRRVSLGSRRSRRSRRYCIGRPLLRFLSPTALSARDALSGAAKPPDNPASAFFLRLTTRASADYSLACRRRPCGFSLCGCDAAMLDMRTFLDCASRSRRRGCTLAAVGRMQCDERHRSTRAPDRSPHAIPIALTSDPSCQAPPLRTSAAYAASCTAAFLSRGVPLRGLCRPSRPGSGVIVLPSFDAGAALLGFCPFAGLLPQTGG